MAEIVWQTTVSGVHYAVHRHDNAYQLFTNGIQHSEFHPERWVTSSVWDLLWLPGLFMAPHQCRRVLVLGLGGGSILGPIKHLLHAADITAVELDPQHIHVARHVFKLDSDEVTMIEADAQQWLADYRGAPFDLIIDDLFITGPDDVSRAVVADQNWMSLLTKHTSEQGVLVMNFADDIEYWQSDASEDHWRAHFPSRFRLGCDDCYNAVIAYSRLQVRSVMLQRKIKDIAPLRQAVADKTLQFTVRQLD